METSICGIEAEHAIVPRWTPDCREFKEVINQRNITVEQKIKSNMEPVDSLSKGKISALLIQHELYYCRLQAYDVLACLAKVFFSDTEVDNLRNLKTARVHAQAPILPSILQQEHFTDAQSATDPVDVDSDMSSIYSDVSSDESTDSDSSEQ